MEKIFRASIINFQKIEAQTAIIYIELALIVVRPISYTAIFHGIDDHICHKLIYIR